MKPKTMILMVVAIVCGLGASYMTSRLLAERGNGNSEAPQVKVLVAKKSLSVGTPIKKPLDLFEVKEFTKGQEPKDAMISFENLKNKYLKRNLRKGDFVTPKDIDENQTAIDIPDGKQAVGIRVTNETSASGLATLPGSKVDIIWTIRPNNNIPAQTATLLENVLVLAADQKINREEGGVAMQAQVVTVALTTEDVQKINLAKSLGDLSFSLRRADDETKTKNSKLTLKQLFQSIGKDENGQDLVEVKKPEQPKEVVQIPQQPQQVQPKPVKVLPKFEKYVVHVREGKKSFDRVFWFNEQGEPVPDSVVKSYLEEAEAASTQESQPPVVNPLPNNNGSQPPAVNPTPNSSGPQAPAVVPANPNSPASGTQPETQGKK